MNGDPAPSPVTPIEARHRDIGGFTVRRLLPWRARRMVGPFVYFDHMGPVRLEAGRGVDVLPHPHIGLATVTYLYEGALLHRDSLGSAQVIRPGDVNWMTAGRGIVHSEMPRQRDGLMWGFQLWVNLPAASKMMEPRYQDIAPERIPELARPGARVRVLAGESGGVAGPVEGIVTQPLDLDVRLEPGAGFEQAVPLGHTAFVYLFEGEAELGEPATRLARGQLGVLGDGDLVRAKAGAAGAGFLLIAARPLREPIARYGPFVMNSEAELRQAFDDFRAGKF